MKRIVSTIYINLVPIESGGGLQNAINFLINLDLDELNCNDLIVIIKNNSTLKQICLEKKYRFIVISNSFISRLVFETFFFFNKKNSIIFTLFGTKPLITWGGFTITGCAYSNLFYSNIKFWSYLSRGKRFLKWAKDKYRYSSVKSSEVVIFETELLKDKAVNNFKFKKERTYFVKMAVNSLVMHQEDFIDDRIDNDTFKILYLGGAHPNKRQYLLPAMVEYMVSSGINDISFLLTMDENESYTKMIMEEVQNRKLEKYIINLGPINNLEISGLISKCNAMINIARLESFSNNFVEAWQMERLLFLANYDWAKQSCRDAAIYLDVDNIHTSVEKISYIKNNTSEYKEIIENGKRHLQTYPTPKEKISDFVKIINKYIEER